MQDSSSLEKGPSVLNDVEVLSELTKETGMPCVFNIFTPVDLNPTET